MKLKPIIFIFLFLFFTVSLNAQKKQEEFWYGNYRYTLKKKGKQPKEVRKLVFARFIENNYFFIEAGGGLVVNASPIQVTTPAGSLLRKPSK